MARYDSPKLYTRPDTEYLWLRFYSAGKLCRRSTGTADPIAAQKILAQHLALEAADKAIVKTRVSIREGFAGYERSGGLDGSERRCFRRLLPLLIEVLDSHKVATFQQLGKVTMQELLEWMGNVELTGDATVKTSDGRPVYCGQFNLTGEAINQAFVFAGTALEFVMKRAD